MQPFRIFISYSRQDKEWVDEICAKLRQNTLYNIWLDTSNIFGGDNWQHKIIKNIKECDCFLYFLSPPSVHSNYCLQELNYALEFGKQILPCVYQECDVPSQILKNNIQYIDVSNKGVFEALFYISISLQNLLVKWLADELSDLKTISVNPALNHATTCTFFVNIDDENLMLETYWQNMWIGFRMNVIAPFGFNAYIDISINDERYSSSESGILTIPKNSETPVTWSEPITNLPSGLKTIKLLWKTDGGTVKLLPQTGKFWIQKID